MITFNEVLTHLEQGKTVELKFHLNYGLYSRHELSLANGKIEDFSYVDDSTSTYTVKQYKRSFHGNAFKKNAVDLEEIT
jgi:hypothetical protein